MSNTVEIVVQGKNEATKIFRQVQGDATESARGTEQAWSKAMNSVESSIQRGGLGATEAGGGFNRMKESARGAGDEVEHMGTRAADSGEKLHRIGEASDEVDTKAMGFRDTITGVQDTFKGLSDSSLSLGDRLFTLGAGIGDLGSAGYNLLVPAFGKAKEAIMGLGDSSTTSGNKLASFAKGAGIAAAAVAVLTIGGRVANEIWGKTQTANIDSLTKSLAEYSRTGKAAGEASLVFGGNFKDLKGSLDQLDDPKAWQAIKNGFESFTGLTDLSDSVHLAKERMNELDQALTALAKQSPAEAKDAFFKLSKEMGLNAQQMELLRQQLPGYNAAMAAAEAQTKRNADGTIANTQALRDYLTQLQAATDPVFNLLNSLNGVTTAQTAYNEAVKTNGVNSAEAKDAAVQLAQAVAQAEAAALNGDISYQNFSTALDHWVQSGAITAQQANQIRDRVNEARGSADRFAKNYNANLFANVYGGEQVSDMLWKLNHVPSVKYSTWVVTYQQQIIGNAPNGLIGMGRATGGPIGHAAEGGGRTGLTMVGENGPELVKLPAGAFVNPAGASSRSRDHSGVSGGPQEVRVILELTGNEGWLMEGLRKSIRTRGGNVQKVIGQN